MEPGRQFEQLSLPGIASPRRRAPKVDLSTPHQRYLGHAPAAWAEREAAATGEKFTDVYWDKTSARNPLLGPESPREHHYTGIRAADPIVTEEFVPSWKVRSAQRDINPLAVEHLANNPAPPSRDGDVEVFEYNAGRNHRDPVEDPEGRRRRYGVLDGNHRVNAALRRGQMFIPVKMYRPGS